MKVKDFADKFRSLAGDETHSIPEEFIINGINWAFESLPTVPKLDRAFAKHYTRRISARNHFRFKLNKDFRRLADLPMLNFYTSTGGDLCPLTLCAKDPTSFYTINGVVSMKKPGTPCQYTIEQENDDIYVVLDRPCDVPLIVDYIAYGYPMPVKSMEDEIDLSAPVEHLILESLRGVLFKVGMDMSFAFDILDYLDNKYIPEVIQMLNKRFGASAPIVLGER